MIRVLVYIVLMGLAVVVAYWLADLPGRVSIDSGGYRIEGIVGVFTVAVFVLMFVGVIIFGLARALRRAPGELARSRRARRRTRGYQALTQGMVAVAAGDADEAGRHARRANALLSDPPLTMLLSAQAAQIEGDEAAAGRYFQAMLGRPEMEFLGLRGLLMQATRAGESTAALEYARRAYQLRPQTPWVLTTLFDLQVRAGRWDEAEKTLDEAIRRRAVDAVQGQRDKTIVLNERGRVAEAAGEAARAIAFARKSLDLGRDFLPATLRIARLLIADDSARRAARIIEDAWRQEPHPDLLALYREALAPADALAWLKEAQKLAEQSPDHPETLLALAEAALAARLWGEARRYLDAALEGADTARACRLRARLEEAEHGDGRAAGEWLSRAAVAAPDPAWVCDQCGAVSADWRPLCRRCDAFDGLVWRAPERAVTLMPPPAPMLAAPAEGPAPTPLIAGEGRGS